MPSSRLALGARGRAREASAIHRRGVDEKMQKREWNDAVSLSREIILSPMNRPGSSRGERQWAGNAAVLHNPYRQARQDGACSVMLSGRQSRCESARGPSASRGPHTIYNHLHRAFFSFGPLLPPPHLPFRPAAAYSSQHFFLAIEPPWHGVMHVPGIYIATVNHLVSSSLMLARGLYL